MIAFALADTLVRRVDALAEIMVWIATQIWRPIGQPQRGVPLDAFGTRDSVGCYRARRTDARRRSTGDLPAFCRALMTGERGVVIAKEVVVTNRA